MEITTLMILMALALVVLAIVVGVLVMCLFHKNDELKEKNNVIVREIRRNQELIDRAVRYGINRAAMLTSMLLPLLLCASMLVPCTKAHTTTSKHPFFTNYTNNNLMKLNFNYDSFTTEMLKHNPQGFDELMSASATSESGELTLLCVTCNYTMKPFEDFVTK
jgi:hypothetical protein